MRRIRIVCDSCGHNVVDPASNHAAPIASTDVMGARSDAAKRALPTRCPSCSAVWTWFHPGDEYLIGLSHVVPARHAPRTNAASRA